VEQYYSNQYIIYIVNSILTNQRSFARWEKRRIHKNGNIVWVDISTTLQIGSDGKPKCFISSIIDITKNKMAKENLRASMQLTNSIIDSSPSLFYLFDLDGKIIHVNQNFESILGIPT